MSQELQALNIEFTWSAGDFIFCGDVINKNMQIESNVLKFNWFDTTTRLGISIIPYQFVFSFTSKGISDANKLVPVEEKYDTSSWGRDFNFSFHNFSFLPVEIAYSPFRIMDIVHLSFYGQMSWRLWQGSYKEFVSNPFSSSGNGFYSAAGMRIAGIFLVGKSYAASIGFFMEYTTKNEFRIGINADLLGSIFAIAHGLSGDFQGRYAKGRLLSP
jgi:hypothetical protein